jgi:hypothetical protein
MRTIEDKIKFIERSFYHLRNKGEINTWTDFAEKVGVSKGTMSGAKNGNERALTDSLLKKIEAFVQSVDNPNVAIHNTNSTNVSNNVATGGSSIIFSNPHTGLVECNNEDASDDLVPVVPRSVCQRPDLSVKRYLRETPPAKLEYTQAIPQLPPTTFFKVSTTDAMSPFILPGDFVGFAEVEKGAVIVNGQMYGVDSKDFGLIVRYLYDEGEYLLLKASNSHFTDFRVKRDRVRDIFQYCGILRLG